MRIIIVIVCAITGSVLPGGEFEDLFDDDDLAIYILSEKSGEEFYYNKERTFHRFTACSTFKIPNSLIALDAGIVSSRMQVFKYDSAKHSNPHRLSADYNKNQTLESAFKVSALWTYQEIAKLVGEEKYRRYLEQFSYGNEDISGGINTFWLSSLKVSAQEQVKFLKKFYNNEFELKQGVSETVREIMFLEERENCRLYGKTGTQLPENGHWFGWIVGFVETESDILYFAINLRADSYKELSSKRMDILNICIERLIT